MKKDIVFHAVPYGRGIVHVHVHTVTFPERNIFTE